MSEKIKKSDAWELSMAALPSKARARMEAEEPEGLSLQTSILSDSSLDDDADAFLRFVDALPPSAAKALLGEAEAPSYEKPVKDTNHRFGLVECVDGEWTVTRTYKKPETLARRLCELDGQDVVVSAFYGIPLTITKGPQRYLMLPGGTQAITIPIVEGLAAPIVDAELVRHLAIEEDGFLGPPELREGRTEDEMSDQMADAID